MGKNYNSAALLVAFLLALTFCVSFINSLPINDDETDKGVPTKYETHADRQGRGMLILPFPRQPEISKLGQPLAASMREDGHLYIDVSGDPYARSHPDLLAAIPNIAAVNKDQISRNIDNHQQKGTSINHIGHHEIIHHSGNSPAGVSVSSFASSSSSGSAPGSASTTIHVSRPSEGFDSVIIDSASPDGSGSSPQQPASPVSPPNLWTLNPFSFLSNIFKNSWSVFTNYMSSLPYLFVGRSS